MRSSIARCLVVCALVLASERTSAASFSVARVFQDHMVLQRGKPIRVWGWGCPGDTVRVQVGGVSAETGIGEKGQWCVEMDNTLSATNGPYEMTVRKTPRNPADAVETLAFADVLVGEVWVLSGQSNMAWNLRNSDGFEEAKKRAGLMSGLRYMFAEQVVTAPKPLADFPDELKAHWSVCSPENAGKMSAAGFFFAERLMAELKVPVGLVFTACGATQIQNWTPFHRAKAEMCPYFKMLENETRSEIRRYQEAGKPVKHNVPLSGHYNAKIAPIERLSVRGVAWYQGETGGWTHVGMRGPAWEFADLLENMIRGWRERMDDPSLRFLVFELPSYGEKHGWQVMRAKLREGALRVPPSAAVNIADTGTFDDVHSHDKPVVGIRGANEALRVFYGRSDILPAPTFSRVASDAQGADVFFTEGISLDSRGESSERSFELKFGERWTNAVARLDRRRNVVRVENPPGLTEKAVGVRYLWREWTKPDVWLFNGQGVPAEGFSTEAPEEQTHVKNGDVLPDFSSRNPSYVISYPDAVTSRRPLKGVMLQARHRHVLTEDDFATLREWGATLLRYQVRLRNDGAIPLPEYLEAMAYEIEFFRTNMIPRARANKMMLVFDLHDAPGGRMRQRPELAKRIGAPMNEHWMYRDRACAEAFVAVWKMAAESLKGNEDVVYGYDLVNEPYQNGAREFNYYDLQLSAARAIRERDKKTSIVFEANGMCSAPHYKWLSPLPLDNVIYEIHNYQPEPYTHQGVGSRPHGAVYPDASKGWDKAYLRRFCTVLESFSRRHGAKILVGEFSAAGWAQGADTWIRDMTEVMDERGWDWCYHAFREWYVWNVELDCSYGKSRGVPNPMNKRKKELLTAIRRGIYESKSNEGDKK